MFGKSWKGKIESLDRNEKGELVLVINMGTINIPYPKVEIIVKEV